MKNGYLTLFVVLLILFNLFLIYTPETKTKGTAVSGDFSGYFDLAGSPYIISDNLTIPFHGFLDIQPGVELRFNDGAVLYCRGELYANGTTSNPIIFTSNLGSPYIGSWKGINFYIAANCQLINCKISYAWWGIKAETCSNITIRKCEIFKCGNATELRGVSKVNIRNSEIHNNLNHGINCSMFTNYFNVTKNKIYYNKVGMRLRSSYYSNVSENNVYNNNRGVRIESSRFLLFENNLINDTDPTIIGNSEKPFNNIGLYIFKTYWSTIRHNNIYDTIGDGIKINRSVENVIDNNDIKDTTENGLHIIGYNNFNILRNNTISNIGNIPLILNLSSKENIFKNNSISKLSTTYAIEYGDDSYWNIFFNDNMVNGVALPIFYGESGNNITSALANLVVTEPKLTNIGQVVIIEAENFTINKLRSSNGRAGLFLYDVQNVTINKSRMIDNDFGIYFGFNSTNIEAINATITNSAIEDLYLDEYSEVTMVNASFDQQKIVNRFHSNLTIQWYVHVAVVYYRGLDKTLIKNADIKIYDSSKKLVFSGLTTKDGTKRFIRITDKRINDTKINRFNDHNISALKINYQPGYAGSSVTIDQTKWITIELTKNENPSLSGSISPFATHKLKPELSWERGTDPENDDLLYWIKISNLNDKDLIIEKNNTDKTKYKVTLELIYGERYQVKINTSDPYGGWSNTITGIVDVINSPPSQPWILIKPAQTKKEPSKNHDLNCTIVKLSFDTDTHPKDEIKYTFLWYKNDRLQPQLSVWNTSKLFHVIPKEHTSTGDVWTCEVTATDGFEITSPITDTRIIRNQPPRVRVHIPPLEMDEDTIDEGSIDLSYTFIDDDLDKLTFSYNIPSNNISIEILDDGKVIVRPAPEWSGYELVQFFASDGELQNQTITKITVKPVNDPPMVRILFPINNTPFLFNETKGISLEGEYDDMDIPYGDFVNLTWISSISGVLGHSAIIRNAILDVGQHKIEFIGRDKQNVTVKDVRYISVYPVDNPPPDITIIKLNSPGPGEIIKSTSVKLSWDVLNLSAGEAENVFFDIYLYPEGEPEDILVSQWIGTNYTVPNLEEDIKYFWTVVPIRNNTRGICLNGVWNFIIDPEFIFEFGVELDIDVLNISVEPGKIIVANITIENTGNAVDTFSLQISYKNNSDLINYSGLSKNSVRIKPGRSKILTYTINIPENYSVTNLNDTISIQALSISGNATAKLTRDLNLLMEKPEPPDKKDKQKPKKEEKPEILDFLLLILGILVVILILIVLFSVLLKGILKQQKVMLYPFKIKKIVAQERKVTKKVVSKKKK